MKQYIFNTVLVCLTLVTVQPAKALERDSDTIITSYDKRIHRMRQHWASLIPTQSIIQYAGNMGLISIGMGWEYGKHRQWETDLLIGYLPKFQSRRGKLTMTLKETFIPWNVTLSNDFFLEPLTCGLYINTVYGHEFWSRQPSRYPDKYYEALSTKARLNVFLGQRIGVYVPHARRKFVKEIRLFYEVSTCDLYVRSMIQDSDVSLWDILGLSLGIKLQLF
ncbi:MAG: hypothetical protein ACI4BA_02780 [Prevotella sp.]